jgi:hypothetical protein
LRSDAADKRYSLGTSKMTKAQVRGEQTTNTFAYMYEGAKYMLKLSESTQGGQLYTTVSSIIYCAFTLEAYLNHLGKLRNNGWDKIERKHSKLDKYELLASTAGINFDNFRARPYITLKNLFKFRDRMAHGRTTTENVNLSIDMVVDALPSITPEGNWKEFATIENAQIAIKDVEKIIKELHSSNGFSGNPFSKRGIGIYGVTHQ